MKRAAAGCISALLLLPVLCGAAMAKSPGKPGSTLERIAKHNEIRMGYRTDSPPFSFLDEKHQPAGYSIDLCNAIATGVATQLKKPNLMRNWVPVTAETRIDWVAKGEIDIECGVTTATLSRRAQVDFTDIVFITGGGLMLRKGHEIESIADLKRKRIAVIRGTTTENALLAAFQKAQIEPDLMSVGSIGEAVAALESKKADAVAEDRLVLLANVKAKNLQDEVSLPPFLYSYEPYAFPVRRNDADFRLAADQALVNLFRSGEIWTIYDRWIGALGAKPNDTLSHIFSLQAIPN